MHVSAAEVLVDNIKDLNRAKDFAERVADSAVWSKVRKKKLYFCCSYPEDFAEKA